jgi:hypothetical protein
MQKRKCLSRRKLDVKDRRIVAKGIRNIRAADRGYKLRVRKIGDRTVTNQGESLAYWMLAAGPANF